MGHAIADNISAEAPCSVATSLMQNRQRLANIVQFRILEQLFFKEISNLGDELFSGGHLVNTSRVPQLLMPLFVDDNDFAGPLCNCYHPIMFWKR